MLVLSRSITQKSQGLACTFSPSDDLQHPYPRFKGLAVEPPGSCNQLFTLEYCDPKGRTIFEIRLREKQTTSHLLFSA